MSTQRDEAAKARARRRRHLHERQIVIFGAIIASMAVVGLAAIGVFTGVLPAPFDREFTLPEETTPTYAAACPPEGATLVPFTEITASVYNATQTSGLAGRTGAQLTDLGVLVTSELNFGAIYEGVVRINAGSEGITAAYTVAALIPGAIVTHDNTRQDATIDVVLGTGFDTVMTPEQAVVTVGDPIAVPADCVPINARATTPGS